MIFVATFGIGLAAGLTRSVLSVIVAILAIFATFTAAAVVGAGASFLALLVAICGYNFGLVAFLVAHYAAATPVAEQA